MKRWDLDLRELLSFSPGGGRIRFGGQRVLLLDAVALGLLRKELIDTLGLTAARGILTRFGYAHGWRTAETLRTGVPLGERAGVAHRRRAAAHAAGARSLRRARSPPPSRGGPRSPSPRPSGASPTRPSSTCSTSAGRRAGVLDADRLRQRLPELGNGREIYCIEDRCRGRGDAICHVVGAPAEEWGAEIEPAPALLRARLPRRGAGRASRRRCSGAERQAPGAAAGARARLGAESRGCARASWRAARRCGACSSSRSRVAKVDSTVLITGESGGGQGAHRAAHPRRVGARGPAPSSAVNCGAVPETLLESELFGHARGAFTGADAGPRRACSRRRPAAPSSSTRSASSPLAMQVKLLRVLQEREVRRVGENQSRPGRRARGRRHQPRPRRRGGRRALPRRTSTTGCASSSCACPPLRERREDVLPLARAVRSPTSARAHGPRRSPASRRAAADQLLALRLAGQRARAGERASSARWRSAQGSRVDARGPAGGGARRAAQPLARGGRPAAARRRRARVHPRGAGARTAATGPHRARSSASAPRRCTASSRRTGRCRTP